MVRGVTRENVLAARALFDRALTINPNSARAWGGVQFTTTAVLSNGWVADRPTAIRRAEEAAANLQRLDRDGNYTYSSKTFLLFMKRDFPGMLRTTTEWSERYRLPLAFGAHGAACCSMGGLTRRSRRSNVRFASGPGIPSARTGSTGWRWRTSAPAATSWPRVESTAANTTPTLVWPPIHAAALLRLGRREAAQQAFDEHVRNHPEYVARHLEARIPNSESDAAAQMRSRLIASLRELGMRD